MSDLRNLPSVDKLLQSDTAAVLIAEYGRPLTVEALRFTLSDVRKGHAEKKSIPDEKEILERSSILLAEWTAPTLVPVINATGVVLHTNLGRAPLSSLDFESIQQISTWYSNLEYDLDKGRRGSRTIHAEELLKRITGAESALVVNNNAGAVLLVLSALARRRRVIISRTQLVEIGGGFRVPDVMKQSGARLHEIGTTNRVHLYDYETALQEPAGLVLLAHHSNFKIVGFTMEPDAEEIIRMAHQYEVPVVNDLGSGVLLNTEKFGLSHEPTIQEALQAGADVVCVSGDKLLGGPQAGIIIGKEAYLKKIKKHPLARALRADKLCLSYLTATLLHYLRDEAVEKIPVWRMISADLEEMKKRAEHWREVIGTGQVVPGKSTVGGGSLPGETLPTSLLSVQVKNPDLLLKKLRLQKPPVIARISDNEIVFDPRTVLPEQEDALLAALRNVL